jgi:tetratricopeptide (TPR) repeat protein
LPPLDTAIAFLNAAWAAIANVPGGIPTELSGAALGALIAGRFAKLRQRFDDGAKDQNHDLQQALSDSYWLSLVYLTQQHAAERETDPLAPPPNLAGLKWASAAWDLLRGLVPQSLPCAGSEKEREALRSVIECLLDRLEKPNSVDVAAVYAEVEKLLARDPTRTNAREQLLDQAVQSIKELANDIPNFDALANRVNDHFDEYFRLAFAARLKENPRVETIFNSTLIAETREIVAVIEANLTAFRAESKEDHGRIEELLRQLIEQPGRRPASVAIIPTQPAACHGREDELRRLAELLLPRAGSAPPVLVCSVQGLPGVGKSLLVDTFAYLYWQSHFPGGYVSLRLSPNDTPDATILTDRLAQALGIPAAGGNVSATVRNRLADPRTLLHIENVDSDDAAKAAAALLTRLPGVPAVLSSRVQNLGAGKGWLAFPVEPVSEAAALQILAEYGVPESVEAKALAERLGYLPLALRLLGSVIADGFETLTSLLAMGSLIEIESRDPIEQDRHRQLRACFDISLRAFQSIQQDITPLRNFGFLPLEGAGTSLAAAWIGLADETAFRQYCAHAKRLSLVTEDGGRWRAHPLLASYLRSLAVENAAEADSARFAGTFAWLRLRFPEGDGAGWNQVAGETPALAAFLDAVPAVELWRVERAASVFAIHRGPNRLWMRFCERALNLLTAPRETSDVLWTYANVAQSGGALDLALSLAERKVKLDANRGVDGERELALAWGKIADIRMARGDLDEALRIRLEEELPVYEKLGDVRSRAVTQGRIAQIHAARGDLQSAIKLLESEVIPVRMQLNDQAGLVFNRAQLAVWLYGRDPASTARAIDLFQQALAAARRMRLGVASQIESIMKDLGL